MEMGRKLVFSCDGGLYPRNRAHTALTGCHCRVTCVHSDLETLCLQRCTAVLVTMDVKCSQAFERIMFPRTYQQSYQCRLQMYLVLGVVSLYQSNFEPLAQFDHRHLLPTPTGGGALAGAGKGSGNRGDSGNSRTEVS